MRFFYTKVLAFIGGVLRVKNWVYSFFLDLFVVISLILARKEIFTSFTNRLLLKLLSGHSLLPAAKQLASNRRVKAPHGFQSSGQADNLEAESSQVGKKVVPEEAEKRWAVGQDTEPGDGPCPTAAPVINVPWLGMRDGG